MAFVNSGSGGRGKPFEPHAEGARRRGTDSSESRGRRALRRRRAGETAVLREETASVRPRSGGPAGEPS